MKKSLEIKLSYKCEQSCNFCLFADRKLWPPMNFQMAKGNIDYFENRCGINELVFSGGEPTEVPFFNKLCSYAKSKQIKSLYIHTKCDENFHKCYDSILSNVNRIMFSYPRIGGHSALTDDLLIDLPKDKIAIRANILILLSNYKDLLNIAHHLLHIGIKNFLFTYPFPLGNTYNEVNKQIIKDANLLKKLIIKIISLLNKHKVKITFQGFPRCFLRPYHLYQEKWIDRFLVDYYHQKENKQLLFEEVLKVGHDDICNICTEKENCNGIWKHTWQSKVFKLEPFLK